MIRLRRKLRDKSGVTLSEMLVAVAVLGLVTLAIAVGASSALRIYRASVALSDAQTLSSTLAQALIDELRFARDMKVGAGDILEEYTSANYGMNARVGLEENKVTITATAAADESGAVDRGSYSLLGSGAYSGLAVGSMEITYGEEAEGCFTVTFTIQQGDQDLRETAFSVRALNPG